ncbi:MAG: TIGR02449 family protein [Gammaproteobacteria bacterium]|nr:MAG: TIGR02449 family protein [Gammaproteobacteria bacterium]RLA53417.1 MAG: TIGR02449 family protein [Gammaproteobacteria bacterium]
MSTDTMANLEQKIDQLVELANRLKQENISLQERESDLLRERGELFEKNEQARHRVERMITRLKNLAPEG